MEECCGIRGGLPHRHLTLMTLKTVRVPVLFVAGLICISLLSEAIQLDLGLI
jgi:hypothetical protein